MANRQIGKFGDLGGASFLFLLSRTHMHHLSLQFTFSKKQWTHDLRLWDYTVFHAELQSKAKPAPTDTQGTLMTNVCQTRFKQLVWTWALKPIVEQAPLWFFQWALSSVGPIRIHGPFVRWLLVTWRTPGAHATMKRKKQSDGFLDQACAPLDVRRSWTRWFGF